MVSELIDLGHPPFMHPPSSIVLREGCIWKKTQVSHWIDRILVKSL